MGKPGGTPIGERVRVGHSTVNVPPHHQPGPDRRTYGETADYRDLPAGGQHVTVNIGDGPQPGLLVGWRKPDQLPWEGRVFCPLLLEGRWVVTSRWVPAGAIKPV